MISVLRMRNFVSADNEKWLRAFVRVRSSDSSRTLCGLVSMVTAISRPRSLADALGGRKVSVCGWPVSSVRCRLWIASFKIDNGLAVIGFP